MTNKGIATVVKDGSVYVKMDELLEGLYAVCNKWQMVYTQGTAQGTEQEAAQRLIGMVDLCKGMEYLHDEIKAREGLT